MALFKFLRPRYIKTIAIALLILIPTAAAEASVGMGLSKWKAPLFQACTPPPDDPNTGTGPLPPASTYNPSDGLGEQQFIGYGVNAKSGQFVFSKSILSREGRGLDFDMVLTYRSQSATLSKVGHGWDLNYFMKLVPNGSDFNFHAGNGRVEQFNDVGGGVYISSHLPWVLTTSPLSLKTPSGTTYNFDATPGLNGRLTSIVDRNGNTISCGYNATSGLLETITDTLGVVTGLFYDGAGFLTRIVEGRTFSDDPASIHPDALREVYLLVAAAPTATASIGDLWAISSPGRGINEVLESYQFINYHVLAPHVHNISLITNLKLQQPYCTIDYDTSDRVVKQVYGDALGEYNISYQTVMIGKPDNQCATTYTTLNDRNGFITDYYLNDIGNCLEMNVYGSKAANSKAISTPPSNNWATVTVAPAEAGQSYMTQKTFSGNLRSPGLLKKLTKPMGGLIEYARPYTTATDRRAENRITGRTQTSDGRPGTTYTTITESWGFDTVPEAGGVFNKVATYTDPGTDVTTMTHNASGDMLTKTLPNVTSGFEIGEDTALTTTYTHNGFGQVLTIVDPLSASEAGGVKTQSTTRFVYGSTAGTDEFGRVISKIVDDTVLNLTENFEYNIAGDTTKFTDARSNDWTKGHNARRAVFISRTALNHTTQYGLDGEDNALTVTDPANHVVSRLFNVLNAETRKTEQLNPTTTAVTETIRDASNVVIETQSPEGARYQTKFNTRYLPYVQTSGFGAPLAGSGYTDAPDRTVTSVYDANGFKDSSSLPADAALVVRTTNFERDGFDRPHKTIDPYGAFTRKTLDAEGLVLKIEVYGEAIQGGGGGAGTRFREIDQIFNEADRLVTINEQHFDTLTQNPISGGVNTTNFTWFRDGRKATTVNDNGNAWLEVTDSARRHLCTRDPLGNENVKTLDANGNITQTDNRAVDSNVPFVVAQTFITGHGFDADNRRTSTTVDPGGLNLVSLVNYGVRNEVLSTRDAEFNFVFSHFDEALRLIAQAVGIGGVAVPPPSFTNHADPNYALTEFILNRDNVQTGRIDPRNNTWTTAHNDRLEPVTITNPDTTTKVNEFDTAGFLTASTDERGCRLDYTVSLNMQVEGYQVTALGTAAGLADNGTVLGSTTRNGVGEPIRCRDEDSDLILGWDSMGNRITDTQTNPDSPGDQNLVAGIQAAAYLRVFNNVGTLASTITPATTVFFGVRDTSHTYWANEEVKATTTLGIQLNQQSYLGYAVANRDQTIPGISAVPIASATAYDNAFRPQRETKTAAGTVVFGDKLLGYHGNHAQKTVQDLMQAVSEQYQTFPLIQDARQPLRNIAFGVSTTDFMAELANPGSQTSVSYYSLSQDENLNNTQELSTPRTFDTRNGIDSLGGDTWLRDSANNLTRSGDSATIDEYTNFVDCFGQVCKMEHRAIGGALVDTWEYKFDGTHRRTQKKQTFGGTSVTNFAWMGGDLQETMTNWGFADFLFFRTEGVSYWTGRDIGGGNFVFKTVVYGHDGLPQSVFDLLTGQPETMSGFGNTTNEIMRTGAKLQPLGIGALALATSSEMVTYHQSIAEVFPGGYYDAERGAVGAASTIGGDIELESETTIAPLRPQPGNVVAGHLAYTTPAGGSHDVGTLLAPIQSMPLADAVGDNQRSGESRNDSGVMITGPYVPNWAKDAVDVLIELFSSDKDDCELERFNRDRAYRDEISARDLVQTLVDSIKNTEAKISKMTQDGDTQEHIAKFKTSLLRDKSRLLEAKNNYESKKKEHTAAQKVLTDCIARSGMTEEEIERNRRILVEGLYKSHPSMRGGGSGRSRGCFIAGTLVWTKDGLRAIESIAIGDLVLSYSEVSKKLEYRQVTKLIRVNREDLYTVTAGDEVITCSSNHRFFTAKKSWLSVGSMADSIELMSGIDGQELSLTSVKVKERNFASSVRVFNFTVEGNHNYFVGKGCILVHNEKPAN